MYFYKMFSSSQWDGIVELMPVTKIKLKKIINKLKRKKKYKRLNNRESLREKVCSLPEEQNEASEDMSSAHIFLYDLGQITCTQLLIVHLPVESV